MGKWKEEKKNERKKGFFRLLLKMFRMEEDGTENDVISNISWENDSLDIERTMTTFVVPHEKR